MGEDFKKISDFIYKLVEAGERKYVIFPYGYIGRLVEDVLVKQFGIVPSFILDNKLCLVNDNIEGSEYLRDIDTGEYAVVIASENPAIIDSMRYQVYSIVKKNRIFEINYYAGNEDRRVTWLRNFSEFCYKRNAEGSVAECGVFRGDFARYINEFFPDKNCYLFDSFEGFYDDDIVLDREYTKYSNVFSSIDYFAQTSVSDVISKMPHKEKVIIKKGKVPDTFKNIDDIFCFVNLDMDLYKPMIEGLRFFYPRMSVGGVIMCHDYYTGDYP